MRDGSALPGGYPDEVGSRLLVAQTVMDDLEEGSGPWWQSRVPEGCYSNGTHTGKVSPKSFSFGKKCLPRYVRWESNEGIVFEPVIIICLCSPFAWSECSTANAKYKLHHMYYV